MDHALPGSAELAYLGDAVFEVMVREHLIRSGGVGAGNLNRMSLDYVRATAQSQAVEKILPLLSETEEGVFRRARNNIKSGVPKSASPVEYKRATGLEALFGYLFLSEQKERMYELFAAAFDLGQTDPD